MGLHDNETARECDWMVPATHYLESWSDARAYDGTLSVVQPLIAPLYDGKTTSQILATLVDESAAATSSHDLLRAAFSRRGLDEDRWRAALGKGLVADTAYARVAAPPSNVAACRRCCLLTTPPRTRMPRCNAAVPCSASALSTVGRTGRKVAGNRKGF